jgi:hypothetical protein
MGMRVRGSTLSSTLLGCALVMALLLAVGCGDSGDSAAGGDRIYTDPDYGFSFEYPATWRIQEGDSSGVTPGGDPMASVKVYNPEGTVANDTYIDLALVSVYELNVVVEDSTMPKIRAEVERVIADLERLAVGMQTVEALSEAEVNGMPGFETTYTFPRGDTTVKSTLYFLFDGDIEYQFTMQAATENWEKNTPIFDALVSSFQPAPAE